MSTARAKQIARLNDANRTSLTGLTVNITSGIQALGGVAVVSILRTVTSYNAFTKDNDPHDEHDFGAFKQDDNDCFWKIDYYASDMLHGSEDPADPKKTVRVLTIMLASEY
jgi:Protein of unknown function (DUF3768)